jgi:hypothetical protein
VDAASNPVKGNSGYLLTFSVFLLHLAVCLSVSRIDAEGTEIQAQAHNYNN